MREETESRGRGAARSEAAAFQDGGSSTKTFYGDWSRRFRTSALLVEAVARTVVARTPKPAAVASLVPSASVAVAWPLLARAAYRLAARQRQPKAEAELFGKN